MKVFIVIKGTTVLGVYNDKRYAELQAPSDARIETQIVRFAGPVFKPSYDPSNPTGKLAF